MRQVLAWSVLVLFSSSACGKDDCEAIVDLEMKCTKEKRKKKGKDDDDDMPSKSLMVAACKEAKGQEKHKKEFESIADCAKKAGDDCDVFTKCEAEASEKEFAAHKEERDKERAARDVEEIEKQLENGKVKEAISTCSGSYNVDKYKQAEFKEACAKAFAKIDKVAADDRSMISYSCKDDRREKIAKVSPEFDKMCTALRSKIIKDAADAVTKNRDAGKNDFTACFNYKNAAKELDGGKEDGENGKKAEQACGEMKLAEESSKAIKEAKTATESKAKSLPYSCKFALDEAPKVTTDWAKTKIEEVTKACYIDFPIVRFEAATAAKEEYCDYEVEQLYKKVTELGTAAKDPALDAAVKKLPANCKGKD